MSDMDERRNLEDEPDSDGDNLNDDNNGDGTGDDGSGDEPAGSSASAPDPRESGRMDTSRLRSTI